MSLSVKRAAGWFSVTERSEARITSGRNLTELVQMSWLRSECSLLQSRQNTVRISLQCDDCTPVPNSPVKLVHKSKQPLLLEQRRGFLQTAWAASRERGEDKTEESRLRWHRPNSIVILGRIKVFELVSLLHCMFRYSEMLRADSWACSTYSLRMKAFLWVFYIFLRKQSSLINVQMHDPEQLALENILPLRSVAFGSEILFFVSSNVRLVLFHLWAIKKPLCFSAPAVMEPVLVKLDISPQQGDSNSDLQEVQGSVAPQEKVASVGCLTAWTRGELKGSTDRHWFRKNV